MKQSIILCLIAALTAVQAENLMFNGSFELGTSGYCLTRRYRPQKNPKLEKHQPFATERTKTDGRKSLQIKNPFQEYYELGCREFKVEANSVYTISYAAKTDGTGNVQPRFEFRKPGRPVLVEHKGSRLSKDWKRYSFTIVRTEIRRDIVFFWLFGKFCG